MQTTNNLKFRTWLVLFAVIIVQQVAMALSPQLCSPRIGDRLVVKQLDGVPMFVDTLKFCPNLTNSQIEKNLIMQIWEPAPADTVSTFTVAKERIALNISGAIGNLAISEVSKPGFNTRYLPPLPYGVSDSLTYDFDFISAGNIASIGNYKSTGRHSSHLTNNLRVVSTSGDTITNVTCLSNFVNEKIVSGGGDVYIHHNRERRWYAIGYRYPLVAEFNDIIFSQDGDTIDSNCIWQIIEPETIAELENDPVNEYLRSINRNRSQNRDNKNIAIHSINDNIPLGEFAITHKEHSLIITPHADFINSNSIRSLLLCDFHGRVFYYSTPLEQNQSVSVPLLGIPPGVYLLNIESDDSSVIYRFKL